MTDWEEFEARARRAIPAQYLKPKRCWIGVLSHEKAPEDVFDELDFVWMVGHAKIPMQKIHDTYQKRYEDVDFHIRFKDDLVEMDDTIKSFLKPNGDLVLFLARRTDELLLDAQPTPQRPYGNAEASLAREIRPTTPTRSVPPTTPIATSRVKDEPRNDESFSLQALNLIPSMRPAPADAASENAPVFSIQQSAMPPLASTVAAMHFPTAVQDLSTARTDVDISPRHDDAADTMPGKLLAPQESGVVKDKEVPDPVHHHMEEETQVLFNPEGYFNREPSPEQASQEDAKPTDRAIREIIAQQDPDLLEAGVTQSLKVLQRLKSSFSEYPEIADAQAWIEAIDKLVPQAVRKRTIVGVVGNTGAGKSSVINAMLDEERLVPTNCMRACTAVVTEMSYNTSDEPSSRYRAEIEFITRDDWEKEVATLMKEFMTENGAVSRDVADENSDAGIAWAKFHSVYPKRTRDSLNECTVESLMSERSVLAILGTTNKINSACPNSFYQQLQRYVDSKEKVTKKGKTKGSDKPKKSFEMEYWPLVKVVKIYVKAPALSTGAVIVDLPGVHDSNPARAAVAQGYMKQCTGLWIVAPINRAVDDKAAKTLLGESFKRQLKYDGGLSSVTFICSKTDDISITEAVDSLELEDEVEELYNQQRNLEKDIERVKEDIDELQESRDVYQVAQKETSNDIETWEELQEALDEGKTVYAPQPKKNKKRKKQPQQKDARKKRHTELNDSQEDFVVSDEDSAQSESEGASSDDEDIRAPQNSLTEEEIKAKLKELREAKKAARRSSLELSEKIKELRPKIGEYKKKIAAIKSEISHICIAGRNDYSKRAIQQDFAAGIKELDQENAAEEDEDNFNPDEELRDYDEVAKSLPVFCVSSRAYQQMSGRLQKDEPVPGFETPEETEIPQLQAHCKKLTEAGRIQTARMFLLSLCQQLTTFSLWASDDSTGLKMTDDDKRKQVRYLDKRLGELEKGLEDAVRACLNTTKQEMNAQIFDKYPELINEAIIAAPETASKWGAHKADGGLFWGTYKAVVRRDGSYHSATAGHRDFNADLVNPIIKKLATGWERAFQNRLPKAFDALCRDSGKLLHNFHEAVEERARSNGVGIASLTTLKMQIYTYEQLFADLNQVLLEKMNELQRDANRDFTPTIANIMHTVYDICANESGTGSYKRMKQHMSDYVERCRHHMFSDATLTVKRNLDSMCKALEDVMEERADEIYIKMKGDYTRVLGGGQVHFDQTAVLFNAERALRAEVMEVLKTVDAEFEPIARGEVEQEAGADGAEPSMDEHVIIDEDEGAFESARESACDNDNDDSAMGGMEDTMISETTPSKHLAPDMDADNTSEKENRSLPTPSDEDMFKEEEEA
ncbi:hypothetical protein HBI56_016220 [Parastagonospora nodorum]|nr:hypothetical protein HBH51_075000 [Parastagonospora nodorum]KAH4007956.1 hypothetical protein HBI10_002870 [Parastagonospora nodorum]KAH4016646.1 hypothetical protein HBI13_150880 [Parastagonospora nodorum]KAH4040884.1 hypothetical protein HBI09_015070 [Parastagonospora nodorum]KAH4069218.1 hypothetical protein HBH50_110420 [Parastagonospora nodorum]